MQNKAYATRNSKLYSYLLGLIEYYGVSIYCMEHSTNGTQFLSSVVEECFKNK